MTLTLILTQTLTQNYTHYHNPGPNTNRISQNYVPVCLPVNAEDVVPQFGGCHSMRKSASPGARFSKLLKKILGKSCDNADFQNLP